MPDPQANRVAEGGLEQALRNLEKVPLSEIGDAESDAIRAAMGAIQDALERLKSSSMDGEGASNR